MERSMTSPAFLIQNCTELWSSWNGGYDSWKSHYDAWNGGYEKLSVRWLSKSIWYDPSSNRKYATLINKYFSTEIIFNIGLPQGSFLSLLLSIIYLNDLHKLFTRSYVLLFADDTTLLFSHKQYEQLRSICNTELDIFKEWKETNKLSLKVEKPAMLVRNSSIPLLPHECFLSKYKTQNYW